MNRPRMTKKSFFDEPLGSTEKCLSANDFVSCFYLKDASKTKMRQVKRHLKHCAVCRENKSNIQPLFDRLKN